MVSDKFYCLPFSQAAGALGGAGLIGHQTETMMKMDFSSKPARTAAAVSLAQTATMKQVHFDSGITQKPATLSLDRS